MHVPTDKPVSRVYPAITEENVRDLRAIPGITKAEAATYFGVALSTFKEKLKIPVLEQAWEDGVNEGRTALRRLLWTHAQMKNSAGVTAALNLAKFWLGWSEGALKRGENPDIESTEGAAREFKAELLKNLSPEELAQLELIARKLGGAISIQH